MKKLSLFSLMFLSTVFSATAAFAAAVLPVQTISVGGQNILANQNGLTAYVFDEDANGVSSCYDGCAAAWPPILVDANLDVASPYGVTARKDGTSQLTYQNRPIYLFSGDAKSGDEKGDGLGGVWHIILNP